MDRLATLLRRAADPHPDGQLLAAFLDDRDDDAFAELVRRHGPTVWGVCRRTLPDLADAEDAFQATFLVLVRRASRLVGTPTLGPWLFEVAVRTSANVRRKNSRRRARFAGRPDAVADPRPVPAPAADLDTILLGLPERYRAVLLMCYVEGLTHREAAGRLGCAEGTVSSLVSRGLAKLRAKFAGREPAVVLAVAGVAVPAGVGAATIRSANSLRLAASLSAAALPAVAALTREVLRMFWMKKATAAGLAAVLLVAAGFGVGMSVRHQPRAVGQEKPAANKADPPAGPQPPAAPYLVLSVSGPDGARCTLTEFDARGKVLWGVIPAVDVGGTPKPIGTLFDRDGAQTRRDVSAAVRGYLTRVQKDPNAPKDVRVVFTADAEVGGFSVEALRCCREAGFESVRFTGYIPLGGEIPPLKPGPDGEAEGYKRYQGELVDTKKLLSDYEKALKRL
jgi:RNA polymerase sigma factor (sigma-70 family)